MKILWITNIMMPPLCKQMGYSVPVGGGWLYSSLISLKSIASEFSFAVATFYSGKILIRKEIDNVIYYLLPLEGNAFKYNKRFEFYWKNVNNDFKPDIVHLHGTEFPHGLAFLRSCPNVKSVVSIQGLVSVISKYYLDGMTLWDVFNNITLRDVFKKNLIQNKKVFYERGLLEQEILKLTKNVIGRTSWDKSHTWAINPSAHYFHCNETLRNSFYNKKWNYDHCENYSIFVSQASYPVKGVHQLLKALPFVLRFYPTTKVYIAGRNMLRCSSISDFIHFSGYGKYLKKLIKKYKIEENVIFTGNLNEEQMCEQYLKSNVFICPSSVENSPNSLGEAQLLGMPCIASYVGGIPDMMKGFEHWMYRFEEIEELANLIVEIFDHRKNLDFNNIYAHERHDKKNNSLDLKNIYIKIINGD